jgi:ubiquinone/menaquinone biosynthesis C-methylase UbiE
VAILFFATKARRHEEKKVTFNMEKSQRIRSGFNFFAPFYDFFSFLFFGNSILRSQTYFLPELKKCKTALVFGGGTGKLLMELIKRDVAEQYCYVDISDKMIAFTRKRLKKNFPEKINSVDFVCGSAEHIAATEKFDLIITPCVLDCFTDEKLPVVMQQLQAHLVSAGEWLFIDFHIPEKSLRKSFSAMAIRVMYFAFNVICGLGVKQLPDFEKEFSELNYSAAREKYFLKGLMVARIYKEKNE